MSKQNDGGPAYPISAMCQDGKPFINPGMSLRDYYSCEFAAAWVITLATKAAEFALEWDDQVVFREANKLGLQQADAMLKERSSMCGRKE